MRTKILFIFLLIYSVPVIYAQLPQPDHILFVIEENKNYSEIIGSTNAPYINSLAADSMGALFTNFYAETHPSQPNYLWLFSGSNQGVVNDNVPVDTPFTTPNLGAALLDSGYSFYAYNENLPYIGYEGAQYGNYVRKHNPMANWQEYAVPIPNGIPFTSNVPFTVFPSDYNNLPTVCYVIPNLLHDMHDGTIAQGDTWLQDYLDSYVQWAKTHNSLFVLTFDEDHNNGYGNRIVTILVGAMVQHGNYNSHYNHNNLLRTFEEMYGIGYAGASSDSSAITGCWIFSTPVELSSFNAKSIDGKVVLAWSTSTETNNKGFEIQRSVCRDSHGEVGDQLPGGEVLSEGGKPDWQKIGFVNGNGTTTEEHSYSFTDNNVSPAEYKYRLKQINLDGSFEYSDAIDIEVQLPEKFVLNQNYPDPFNPSTTLSFVINRTTFVSLKVYDPLGKEVATLVDEERPSGGYAVEFDGSNLSSGVYFYQLKTGDFVQTKKMLLLK